MDRDKLSPKLKHWLTAYAKVYYGGDEDAAWERIKSFEADNIRLRAESKPGRKRARAQLKISSKNQ